MWRGGPAEGGWPYLAEDTRPVSATVDPHAETDDWEPQQCPPPTDDPETVTFVGRNEAAGSDVHDHIRRRD